MTKNMKRMLFLGVLFLIVGGIMYVIGMSYIGWNYEKLDPLTYTEHTLDLNDEIFNNNAPNKFDFSVEDFDLRVQNGSEFSLKYYTTEDSIINYSLEGNTLKFVSEDEYVFYKGNIFTSIATNSYRGIARSAHNYILTVPNNMPLVIDNKSGNLFIEGDFASADITLKNGHLVLKGTIPSIKTNINNGNAELEVIADSLNYEHKNGHMSIHDSEIKSVDAKVNNGGLVASNIIVENDFKAVVNNGSISFIDFSLGSLNVESDNSICYLNDGSINGSFDFDGDDSRLSYFDIKNVDKINLSLDDTRLEGNRITANELNVNTKNSRLEIYLDVKKILIEGNNNTLRFTSSTSIISFINVNGHDSKLRTYLNGERVGSDHSYGTPSTNNLLEINGNNNSIRVYLDNL